MTSKPAKNKAAVFVKLFPISQVSKIATDERHMERLVSPDVHYPDAIQIATG